MMIGWNSDGVIPPFISPEQFSPSSPYRIGIVDLIQLFSLNATRVKLLESLLDFRQKLYRIGLNSGYQWIDGSFVEDVESIRGREPRDIDLVTFYDLPAGTTTQEDLQEIEPSLFDHDGIKSQMKLDTYWLKIAHGEKYFSNFLLYWYRLFGHQRETFAMKGYFEILLDSNADQQARAILMSVKRDL